MAKPPRSLGAAAGSDLRWERVSAGELQALGSPTVCSTGVRSRRRRDGSEWKNLVPPPLPEVPVCDEVNWYPRWTEHHPGS